MNILIVIPARGGSKSIPRKNVALFNGSPLISFSIVNALKFSASFKDHHIRTVVSSDDDEILKIANLFGCDTHKRSLSLSDDHTTLDPVIFDAYNKYLSSVNLDYVITLQPTSPCLQVNTLVSAFKHYLNNDFDTLISCSKFTHLEWSHDGSTYQPLYEKRVNRQFLATKYVENGAFLITKSNFISNNNRIGPNVSLFEIPLSESTDIDYSHDWSYASKLFSNSSLFFCFDFLDFNSKITFDLIYSFLKHFPDFNSIIYIIETNYNLINFISNLNYTYKVYKPQSIPENLICPIFNSNNLISERSDKFQNCRFVTFDFFPSYFAYLNLDNIILAKKYNNSQNKLYSVYYNDGIFSVQLYEDNTHILDSVDYSVFATFITNINHPFVLLSHSVDVSIFAMLNNITVYITSEVKHILSSNLNLLNLQFHEVQDLPFFAVSYKFSSANELRNLFFNHFRSYIL